MQSYCYRMPRGPRLDFSGALHHVIVRGIERRRIFRSESDRELFLDRLAEWVLEARAGLYAWAFMPNHAHLLLRTGQLPLSRLWSRTLGPRREGALYVPITPYATPPPPRLRIWELVVVFWLDVRHLCQCCVVPLPTAPLGPRPQVRLGHQRGHLFCNRGGMRRGVDAVAERPSLGAELWSCAGMFAHGAECGIRRIMPIEDTLRLKRAEILRIAARHGARNVRVFGSAVRGEMRPESDVDFLVDVGQEHSPFFPGGLLSDLEDLLGCPVDVVTENALHWYIRERVLREAVPL